MEWNEQKAEEIVKKYKNRFSLRLTMKVVRILFVLFIIYFIYKIVLTFAYDYSKIGKQIEFYQQLAIDWTDPQLTSEFPFYPEPEITPLLMQKIEFPLLKRVGKEEYEVGQLNLEKPLLFSWVKTNRDEEDFVTQQFYFNIPYHPITNEKLGGDEDSATWETLEMLHKGHVANLAFSTDEYHSPEEIVELMKPYDVDVLWMPLYMGELQNFDETSWAGSENSMSFRPQWGLAGAREYDEDYMGGSIITVLNNDFDNGQTAIEESQEAMLENMENMLNKNKRLAELLLETGHLKERYDYLKENGFQAYGAVVTGPVKELLKLKELDGIHSVMLGEVEIWNWNE